MRYLRAIFWVLFAWRDYRVNRPGLRGRWQIFRTRGSWSRCTDCGRPIFIGTERRGDLCRDCDFATMVRIFKEAWPDPEP